MTLNSSLATVTALSIFSSASRRVSSIMFGSVVLAMPMRAYLSAGLSLPILPLFAVLVVGFLAIQAADQRADLLAADGPDDVPLAHEGEHHDRQPVIQAQADRRGVHHLQPTAEVLTVVQPHEADRVRRGVRIGVVDAVDLGALEDRVRADLQGSLRGGGVRREERGAQAGPEDHDAALLQVPDRPARDVRLR